MSNSARFTEKQYVAGGRFSSVFKARDTLNDRFVALKVTTPDDDRPPHSSRDELKILQALNSSGQQHFIHLLDSFTADLEDLVMVFPYFPYTLNSYLRSHARKNISKFNSYASIGNSNSEDQDDTPDFISNLPSSKANQIVLGIAAGLKYLHSHGIIHRDIKPENVMFLNFDPNPVLIDFGISYKEPDNFGKESSSKKICEVSTGVYRAPELIFGISDYSYGIDIWSFGILISLVFSKHLKPILQNDDYGDFRLVSLIFNTFGTPNLETWPEASKSLTFSRLDPHTTEPQSVESILPRADDLMRQIFKKMMVYESSQRLQASEIYDLLTATATSANN